MTVSWLAGTAGESAGNPAWPPRSWLCHQGGSCSSSSCLSATTHHGLSTYASCGAIASAGAIQLPSQMQLGLLNQVTASPAMTGDALRTDAFIHSAPEIHLLICPQSDLACEHLHSTCGNRLLAQARRRGCLPAGACRSDNGEL